MVGSKRMTHEFVTTIRRSSGSAVVPRCLDLMQNVTEELRNAEAPEFRSCFVNPSNQARVGWGHGGLMALGGGSKWGLSDG